MRKHVHTAHLQEGFYQFALLSGVYRVLVDKRSLMAVTHSGVDGAEGHHPLNVIGIAATVGLPAGIVSPLQDELLPTEARVLITNPAIDRRRM